MSELVEFLLARIAEEKERASDLHDSDVCHTFLNSEGWCTCDAEPRVLADCEAKQRIVESLAKAIDYDESVNEAWSMTAIAGDGVLNLLALPYADHPDYREEWKP